MTRFPFIAIEGQDGTGKTTVRKGMYWLWNTLFGVEPLCVLNTNFLSSSVAADLVDGRYDPRDDNADLYRQALMRDKEAAYRQLVTPALPHRPVIADRWILSDLVFFAVKHGTDPLSLYKQIEPGIKWPADATVILELSAEDSLERAHSRRTQSTRPDWDTLDIQERVRTVYADVIREPDLFPALGRIVTADASREPGDVLHGVWNALSDVGVMSAGNAAVPTKLHMM